MITMRTATIATPVLALGVLASLILHQPSDQASAFADGSSAIYAAQVVSTQGTPGSGLSRLGAPTPVAVPSIGNVPRASADWLSAALAPASGFDVRGRPTISVAGIEQVLQDYNSPMAGHGQAIYDLGLKYGLDPAFCLAFFIHESAAGTRGEAVLTHSVGNIRAVAGSPSRDGYKYYATWEEGAEDWYRLISTLYVTDWKLTTVAQIIPVYAPSGDSNDPQSYINDVQNLVAAWRAQGA